MGGNGKRIRQLSFSGHPASGRTLQIVLGRYGKGGPGSGPHCHGSDHSSSHRSYQLEEFQRGVLWWFINFLLVTEMNGCSIANITGRIS